MNDEEKIIDIKDMLYRTCRRWRSICACGFMFFVCALFIQLPTLIQCVEKATNNILIETIMKYGGLGFVIGIILAAFFYMVSYILSDKIYLAEDLIGECGINLIGIIPPNAEERKNLPDRLIRSVFGIKVYEEMQEALIERTAEEILVLVAVQDFEWKDAPVIALVSSLSADVVTTFEKQVVKKLKKDIQIVNAGNILQDARGIRMVNQADFVILVEQQGGSTFKEYRQVCRKLSLWKKNILGVVLLDVV